MRIQQFYNIADSLVAGKFIGENALAAVGNSYEITLIFIAFAFGCNIGCSVKTPWPLWAPCSPWCFIVPLFTGRQKKKRRCNFFDMGESPSFHDETK